MEIEKVSAFQRNEITEYHVYKRLANLVKGSNSQVLASIAEEERKHYEKLKGITKRDVKPSRWKIFFYSLTALFFGLTFTLKIMEKNEKSAERGYLELQKEFPELAEIMKDEEEHEEKIAEMIDEERLKYVSSMVLGLSDALVELTGALAGLTFAFQNTKIVGLSGLITGIAAAFSMAVSEYLSQKSEIHGNTKPLKAALYTGLTYIVTVSILVLPFLIVSDRPFFSLILSLLGAVLIVFFFTYYVSIVRDEDFKKRFLEMILLCFGVAAFSFFVGFLVRRIFGIEI